MTSDEGFLRAIVDNPDDDNLRLVYADWLEELGDPRGDLIRVQIALTTGGLEPQREAELHRREQELLTRFGPSWLQPLAERGWTVEFRRGLPEPARPPEFESIRMRPSRVHISYDQHCKDPPETELPFVVVLADLSAQRREGVRPLRLRRFLRIDRDNFDDVLARVHPELHLTIASGENGGKEPLDLHLDFQQLAGFEPSRLIDRVPELRRLLETGRHCEQDRVATSQELSSMLAAILHHPDFQRLEATWRGLHYLVHQTETNGTLKIRVLDASKRDLFEDLAGAGELEGSVLFEKVYANEFHQLGGEPYGLLVGDYEFDHSAEDITFLQRIARVAAASHTPFVAAASSRLFGCEHFSKLTTPTDLAKIFTGSAYANWRSFRAAEDSRYVALTLPRILARLPHRASFQEGPFFTFEESVNDKDGAGYLWMSAAWAYAVRVAAAVTRYNWMAQTRGPEGGKVEGLPRRTILTHDAGVALECPTEIAISDRREFELSSLGFLPLLHCQASEFAFLGAQSCQKPPENTNPEARMAARLLARFNHLLCLSRFVHYLKVMMRDMIQFFTDIDECQRWLNAWISQYVLPSSQDAEEAPLVAYYRQVLARARPLADARVEVQPVKDKPGCYEVVAWLRPSFQLEDSGVALRVVTAVPRYRPPE